MRVVVSIGSFWESVMSIDELLTPALGYVCGVEQSGSSLGS